MKGDREKCLQKGMDGYIAKPINPQELMDVMRKFILPPSSPSAIFAGKKEISEDEKKKVFNWDHLLLRMDENKEFCKEIVRDTLEIVPSSIEKLKEALSRKDSEELIYLAHTLKGLLSNMEAGIMAELAFNVERCGKEDKLDEVSFLIFRLEEEFERFKVLSGEIVS